jgi:hypothetical protein
MAWTSAGSNTEGWTVPCTVSSGVVHSKSSRRTLRARSSSYLYGLVASGTSTVSVAIPGNFSDFSLSPTGLI